MEDNLIQLKKEYQQVLEKLSDPEIISNWDEGDELIKRKALLEKLIEKNQEINQVKDRLEENKSIILAKEDYELISLAEVEIDQLQEKKQNLEKELNEIIGEEKISGPKSIIIEIRAGTGGDEAALFAADLFKMYSKYSQTKEWQQKILDSKPTEIGGLKEITFEIKGNNVWPLIKHEAGVHRVQRIPNTEKAGRIHTSTASVAVLPKPKKGKIDLKNSDLKIDTYKASGPGGQHVNKRMTAIRITHLPSKIVVNSQNERSLQQNKENALSILEAKLLKNKIEEEERKLQAGRKTQIGKADRSEKIRTYNFPQNRITDHRIKKSFHNLDQIMEGKLEQICLTLQKIENQ